MILTPSELPSNGLDPKSESILLDGLGYQDLLTYSHEYESARTPLKKFLVDYEWIKKKVSNWKSINLMDLDAIILMWKVATVSETNEFSVVKKCPVCGHEQELNLTLEQLSTFVPTQFHLSGTVTLSGTEYEYKCPQLADFEEVVTRVIRSGRVKDIEILKLISMFPRFRDRPNEMEALVINAKVSDIQALKLLAEVFFNDKITIRTRCANCKQGDWSMRVASLIDAPFLSLVLSNPTAQNKVILEQVR